eukprot:CAMPEP_0194219654 /NCGR_PEP_ID=MMETSP0156-20130528/26473_1 /TAXON_ID=33649 /ORGANISM="Thalassionema nitzschioides, Strain L26-B" /LENGTH=202 /DNA_ID=CAMNT_0038949407 /DNA_START=18 /DNA_END=626 /DNA_ORIENTATION=+
MTMLLRLFYLALVLQRAIAFVTPSTTFRARKAQALSASPFEDFAASLVVAADAEADDFVQAMNINDVVPSGAGDSILGLLQNFASVVVIGTVFLFGLTFVVANFVIPAAAKQLEQQTKDLDMNLWNEYQAKLEPEQTIDQRPELMQELGNKVQELLKQQYESDVANVEEEAKQKMEKKKIPEVMDATILSKEEVSTNDDQWQ